MIKKIIKYTLLMVLVPLVVFGGTNVRFSDINLKEANYVELPEIAVPSGNPSENTAWFYCKDFSGVSNLYFENDAGTVFNLSAPSYAGNIDNGLILCKPLNIKGLQGNALRSTERAYLFI